MRPVMRLETGAIIDDTEYKTHPHTIMADVDDVVVYELTKEVYDKFINMSRKNAKDLAREGTTQASIDIRRLDQIGEMRKLTNHMTKVCGSIRPSPAHSVSDRCSWN